MCSVVVVAGGGRKRMRDGSDPQTKPSNPILVHRRHQVLGVFCTSVPGGEGDHHSCPERSLDQIGVLLGKPLKSRMKILGSTHVVALRTEAVPGFQLVEHGQAR